MIIDSLRCLGIATLVGLAGCARNYEPPPPSDLSVARTSLEKALDCWRLRIAPSELHAAKPSITVFDEDWNADHRLIEYQLLPGEQSAGATIRWPVRLRIARADSREMDIEVVYIVSTNPVIHIGRQD